MAEGLDVESLLLLLDEAEEVELENVEVEAEVLAIEVSGLPRRSGERG
ncbi:MAG: hypothetical protein N3H31_03285 [Candidatus Nezhaarchaeota archaeon]|nr:hypothetical protein [Candidatus Nezhaarchaeota archaeon]